MGVYPFLHSASRLETMHELVGFTGGSAEHFLKGLESNRRDPRPGGNNFHMTHRLIRHGGDLIQLTLQP